MLNITIEQAEALSKSGYVLIINDGEVVDIVKEDAGTCAR